MIAGWKAGSRREAAVSRDQPECGDQVGRAREPEAAPAARREYLAVGERAEFLVLIAEQPDLTLDEMVHAMSRRRVAPQKASGASSSAKKTQKKLAAPSRTCACAAGALDARAAFDPPPVFSTRPLPSIALRRCAAPSPACRWPGTPVAALRPGAARVVRRDAENVLALLRVWLRRSRRPSVDSRVPACGPRSAGDLRYLPRYSPDLIRSNVLQQLKAFLRKLARVLINSVHVRPRGGGLVVPTSLLGSPQCDGRSSAQVFNARCQPCA